MREARTTSWEATRDEAPPLGRGRSAAVLVDDVFKSFRNVQALQGVTLSVAPREFLAITGPSGSGKSTLLSLIGALDRPDAGQITVDGVPVPAPRHAIEFRRQVVGFVFQDNLLMPYLSAQANIETALMPTGAGRHQRSERALELLSRVGLRNRAGHLPWQLSGGERQRVAIARALANSPRLLLADEPTGALDSADTPQILDLLADTREQLGTTLIIVSHDASLTERADRTVKMVEGLLQEPS